MTTPSRRSRSDHQPIELRPSVGKLRYEKGDSEIVGPTLQGLAFGCSVRVGEVCRWYSKRCSLPRRSTLRQRDFLWHVRCYGWPVEFCSSAAVPDGGDAGRRATEGITTLCKAARPAPAAQVTTTPRRGRSGLLTTKPFTAHSINSELCEQSFWVARTE